MTKHDQWLNQGNPADAELDQETRGSLVHDLRIEVEKLYEEYVSNGLDEEIVITTIRESV